MRNSMWRTLAAAAMLMTAWTGAQAEGADVAAIVARHAAVFLADQKAMGVSIGVVQGKQSHAFHFGYLDSARQRHPDDATLYPLASISKTFTGALMAQAALDGKLALEDPLGKYLDGSYPNLAFQDKPIQLFHLLNHRSGLPFILPNPPEAAPDFKSDIPFPQRVDAIVGRTTRQDFYNGLHQVKLAQAPGARFAYSNSAVQLAGYVLERQYGKPFETLLKEKLTAPLGMRGTTITLDETGRRHLADGYDDAGARQPHGPDGYQGAGAIKSTLPDMLRYARWQLDRHDRAVQLTHQPTYRDDNYSVGLNWQLLRAGPRTVMWQDGAIPGFGNLMAVQLDGDIAIVILSNELDQTTLSRLRTLANGVMRELDAGSIDVP